MPKDIGKELAKLVGINVKQALYSERGNFYAPITAFPCALFDEKGFIIVNDEMELSKLKIHVGKRVNVRRTISSLSNYQRINDVMVLSADEVTDEVYVEGAITRIQVNYYERDLKARQACIKYYGCSCFVCGVNLSDIYGEIADGFIHVHHLKPLSEIKKQYSPDPKEDLRPVCPNCHAIIHLRKPPLTIEKVKALLKNKSVI